MLLFQTSGCMDSLSEVYDKYCPIFIKLSYVWSFQICSFINLPISGSNSGFDGYIKGG